MSVQCDAITAFRKGHPHDWVYDNVIYPKYSIARSTFYSYMRVNVEKEIRKLRDKA